MRRRQTRARGSQGWWFRGLLVMGCVCSHGKPSGLLVATSHTGVKWHLSSERERERESMSWAGAGHRTMTQISVELLRKLLEGPELPW